MPQDNRPGVYVEGESVIYRASALGHPLCQLWAARNSLERRSFPRVVQQGMDEGTNLEPVILDLLYDKHGFTFADGRQQVIELNLGAWNGKTLIVRGKSDEVGHQHESKFWQYKDNQFLTPDLPIDVKALTEDQIRDIREHGLPPHYEWQQSVYGLGFSKSGLYYMPIFNKGSWEIEEWSLAPRIATKTIDEIRDRVLQVEEAYAENQMPECPGLFGCQYFYLHTEKEVDELPSDAVAIARARIILSDKIASLTDARKRMDSLLKERISKDVGYRMDGYTITVFANPDRFNTDFAKQLLTDAEIDWKNDPNYIIQGQGTQVRFTPPKKAREEQ